MLRRADKLFHGEGDVPSPTLFGARKDAIADAERRFALALDHAQPRRRRVALPGVGHGEDVVAVSVDDAGAQ